MDEHSISSLDEAFGKLIERMGKIDESNWGPWKLNRDTKRIYMEFPPATYHLPLSDLRPDVLFGTLRDLEVKTWADNDCLGGLVRAAFEIQRASDDPIHTTPTTPSA
ncbi:hypothetical protein [Granulicella aggregans]|uniref:hypothetical protein n=1 Tax=Granulicella aggregans TaxID=474949 RepID=UPI0021E07AA8|nr:hypothetical protein [Granulicella aggregans]